MKYIYALFILLLALFLAAFIQQNGTEIQLRYFSWSTPFLPLSLYMILSFAAGYALAVIVGFSTGLRHRFRASGAERELRQIRSELEQLKKEELAAVSSELRTQPRIDPAEASSLIDTETKAGDGLDGEESREDHDPDDSTVIIGKGGQEEK
jgi:uncharacterized integral membrane protein